MSTLTITDAVRPIAPVVSTRLRITARGRRVVALLASVPVVTALAAAILSGGGALASGEAGAPAGSFETVTVLPGDSLWSIAEDIAPGHDPRDVVDGLMSLNALSSAVLDAGQSLAIPTEYAGSASGK